MPHNPKEFVSSDTLHNPGFLSLLKTCPTSTYLLFFLNCKLFSSKGDIPRSQIFPALCNL